VKNNKERIQELIQKHEDSKLTKKEINELNHLVKLEEIKDFNNFVDEIELKLIKENERV